jgi:hypothetical protein
MTTLQTIGEYHDALIAHLAEQFSGRVNTVAAYNPFDLDVDEEYAGTQVRKPIATPAILIEVETIREGEEDGTDRTPLMLDMVAHCILSARTERMQLALREMASAVIRAIRWHHFSLGESVYRSQNLTASPGQFTPGVNGFDSWRVSWEQMVFLGDSLWAPTATAPAFFYAFAPKTGAAHEYDYVMLNGSVGKRDVVWANASGVPATNEDGALLKAGERDVWVNASGEFVKNRYATDEWSE